MTCSFLSQKYETKTAEYTIAFKTINNKKKIITLRKKH